MQVRDAMSKAVLTVGPEHTLRRTAQLMSARRVGSAVVVDPDGSGVSIITERDVLYAIGAGLDPDVERTSAHITWDVVYAGPAWTLDEAAAAMVRGGVRHERR
jgi:CBS domain-containing protein